MTFLGPIPPKKNKNKEKNKAPKNKRTNKKHPVASQQTPPNVW